MCVIIIITINVKEASGADWKVPMTVIEKLHIFDSNLILFVGEPQTYG